MERYCSYETWIQPSWSVSYRLNTSVNLCGETRGSGKYKHVFNTRFYVEWMMNYEGFNQTYWIATMNETVNKLSFSLVSKL